MLFTFFTLVFYLIISIIGGDFLVKSVIGFSSIFRISSFATGSVILAFCTSIPELFISLKASYSGNADIIIGNIIGSNICNIALCFGVLCVFAKRDNISDLNISFIDCSYLLLSVALISIFSLYGIMNTMGGILCALLFISFVIFQLKRQNAYEESSDNLDKKQCFIYAFKLVCGVICLLSGSHYTIKSIVELSQSIGASKYIISSTIVAFGTSLPELITTLVAISSHRYEIVISNIIGSNIFNILFIMSASAICNDINIIFSDVQVDLYIMIILTILMICMRYLGFIYIKLSGALFIIFYLLYTFFKYGFLI